MWYTKITMPGFTRRVQEPLTQSDHLQFQIANSLAFLLISSLAGQSTILRS